MPLKRLDDPSDDLLRLRPRGVADQVVVVQAGLVDAVPGEKPLPFALAAAGEFVKGRLDAAAILDRVAGPAEHPPGRHQRIGDEVHLERVTEDVPGQRAVDDQPLAGGRDIVLQLVDEWSTLSSSSECKLNCNAVMSCSAAIRR